MNLPSLITGPARTGLTVAASLIGIYLAYVVYRRLSESPDERIKREADEKREAQEALRDSVADANPNSLGYKNPISTIAAFLSGGFYIDKNLTGGSPATLKGAVRLPDSRVVPLEEIQRTGGISPELRFRYGGITYQIAPGFDSNGNRNSVRI